MDRRPWTMELEKAKGASETQLLFSHLHHNLTFKEQGLATTDSDGRIIILNKEGLAKYCSQVRGDLD